MVLGSPRSGRTTTLRGIAAALAEVASPDDVHLYALDPGGGGLAPLVALPHAGAVVSRDQPQRLDRVLTWLGTEVGRRQGVLTAGGHGDLTEQRAARPGRGAAAAPGGAARPVGGVPRGVPGPRRRSPGRPRLPAAARRAVGRAAPGDQRRPQRHGRPHLVDGRGQAAAADGRPGRLRGRRACRHGWSRTSCPRGGAGRSRGRRWWRRSRCSTPTRAAPRRPPRCSGSPRRSRLAVRRPRRVELLPAAVRRGDLPALALGPREVALGVGGDELDPVVLDLTDVLPGLVVAGPPGSGRSSTLVTIAQGLAHTGLPVVAVAPRTSPLRTLPGLAGCVTDREDAPALEALLGDGPLPAARRRRRAARRQRPGATPWRRRSARPATPAP